VPQRRASTPILLCRGRFVSADSSEHRKTCQDIDRLCPVSVRYCNGSDCRRAKNYDLLIEGLPDDVIVKPIKCQGVCSGPVVVVYRDKRYTFRRVRAARVRAALVEFIESGTMQAPLVKKLADVRKLKKKSGKKKRKKRASDSV
jgi:(2Fe-2S) ferredoxin